MGSSTYSADVHVARAATRAATGTPTFIHTAAVASGAVAASLHPSLDIRGKDRESRDSAAHPRSKSIVVMFDHTGSMGQVPVIMQQKLPGLMAMLVGKNYCEHPQVLFGAIGDCFDNTVAPLQVGQFESGNEMDDAFASMLIEGCGGGSNQESYEMALYYFAHHAKMDCLEKRGEKGYMFIIGDEAAYPVAKRDKIESIIGDRVQGDVPIKNIIDAAREKFEIFFIIPNGTQNFNNADIRRFWVDLIGAERVIKLQDPTAVCEAIATTVGLMEGAVDASGIHRDLADVGASATVVAAVTSGLGDLARSTALARVGSGDLPVKSTPSATVRL